MAQLRAEATVVSDVRRLRAKLNATPPGIALANANTAELAKSAASGVFCAHLTTARRPVPDRAEQGRQVSDGQCRHGAAPWLKAVQRPCRGHQSVRPGADTRGTARRRSKYSPNGCRTPISQESDRIHSATACTARLPRAQRQRCGRTVAMVSVRFLGNNPALTGSSRDPCSCGSGTGRGNASWSRDEPCSFEG